MTNFETGADLDKPAFLIEANIHALEVTGCTAALHLIDKLLSGYGSDPKVTRCLDSRAFYVIPRLNPGRRRARPGRPSALRPLERPAVPSPRRAGRALRGGPRRRRADPDDADRDPNGAWKPHPDEPRLLIPREPDEGAEDGEFYRLLWEGRSATTTA